VVFVGSYDGKLYALNATSGAYLWSYLTGDMVVSSPAVAEGNVYVGSYDHVVYAFGSPVSVQTYSVTFTASGLPSGTSWEVTFNSQTQNSTSDSIVFTAENGVYDFSVAAPSGYLASPSSGSIAVKSASVSHQIVFSASEFPWDIVVPALLVVIVLVTVLLAVMLYRRRGT
jgi:outer membrane protein assembly factor BamB